MMLYLVQRTDAQKVTLAADIDPTYAQTFAAARKAGVEVLAYDCKITPQEITIGSRLPFEADVA
jgi:sugar fermentation stimulation protein A